MASKIVPVRIFPDLYNIEDFLDQNHPVMAPDTSMYKSYWQKQEVRCLEGLWGHDYDKKRNKGGFRYMSPSLYYYINQCKIEDMTETSANDWVSPLLRDIDWLRSYVYIVARGFSGMQGDKKHTCNYLAYKLNKGIDLAPREQIWVKNMDSLYDKYGKVKKYVHPLRYLFSTHKEPLGNPLYENQSQNVIELGPRGSGKSFWLANGVIGHEYNFYGKKYYDNEYLLPVGSSQVVGAAQSDKSKDTLDKFEENQERVLKEIQGAYGTGTSFTPGYFYNVHTGTLSSTTDSLYENKYEYDENGIWLPGGSGASIKHVTFTKFNPQAAVGGRLAVISIDELGLLANLITVLGSCETAQIRKGWKFGTVYATGTGGNVEKIVEPRKVFYNPTAYNAVSLPNVYEPGIRQIGLFFPAYYVDSIFKNEQGNTNVELALKDELLRRKEKEEADDEEAYFEWVMSRPLVPSEIFLNKVNSKWPVVEAQDQVTNIQLKEIDKKIYKTGFFEKVDTGVHIWTPDPKLKPVTSWKHGGKNYAINIIEHPPGNLNPPTYKNALFKTVYDPFKKDESKSDAVAFVYKGLSDFQWEAGLQDTIVAEIVAKGLTMNDMNKMVVQLARYYNSKILYENNQTNFYTYCSLTGNLDILQPSLNLITKQSMYNSKGEFNYGVTMNDHLIAMADRKAIEWLLTPRNSSKTGAITKRTIDYVFSLRYLDEMLNYEDKKNYDYISAMRLLQLWLMNEKEIPVTEEIKKQVDDVYKMFTQVNTPSHIIDHIKLKQNEDFINKIRAGYIARYNGVLPDVPEPQQEDGERLDVLRSNERIPGHFSHLWT